MPHSYAETLTLTCHVCGRDFEAEFWLIVDTTERLDLLERIRAGALHDLACPHCGDAGHMDAPLLLFRPDDEPVLLFSPAEETTADEDQEQARQLVEMLQQSLGDEWQDAWLAGGLSTVQRAMVPAVLSADPKAIRQQQGLMPALKEAGELGQHLLSLLNAGSLENGRHALAQFPDLLGDEADELIERLLAPEQPEEAREFVERWRALLHRCREVGVEQAFEEAISDDGPNVPSQFRNDLQQADEGIQRYLLTGDRSALDTIAAAYERILRHPTFADSDDHFKLAVMNNASGAFLRRYQAAGKLDDLNRALELWKTAVGCTPSHSPNLPSLLKYLGNGLLARYRHVGQMADLEEAICVYQNAIGRTPPHAPDLPSLLNHLGNGLVARFEHMGQVADLEEAIRVLQTAVGRTPPQSPDLLGYLNNLGNALLVRYQRAGQLADLEEAACVWERAVGRTPPDSPDLPTFLNNLGNALLVRYQRTGQLADLEEAIRIWESAVVRKPSDSPDLPTLLNGLGLGLITRYYRIGRLEDLEEAIQSYQTAVQLTPPDSPDLSARLANLGNGLRSRYAGNGQLEDLEEAIASFEAVIQRTPPDSPDLPGYLDDLGNGLRDRYTRTGRLEDLEEAITSFETAVQRMPSNSPSMPTLLNNLGLGLHDHYAHTGRLDDLEEAILSFETAIQRIPSESPGMPSLLANLGDCLNARYALSGDPADLDEAIRVSQQAAHRTSTASPDLPKYLNNLSNGLRTRYGYSGDLTDLDEAVRISQQAVQYTSADSPDLPKYLSNLGNALSIRYTYNNDLADLGEAIRVYRQAVQCAPADSSERPAFLNNLGRGLYTRHTRNDDLADLAEAIQVLQQAVQCTPSDSPSLPSRLSNLGQCISTRYARTNDLQDLTEARTYYRRACERGQVAAPQEGLGSASNWGNWALERCAWLEAVDAYAYGLQAIDLLFATQASRAAKESRLRMTQGLPANAAYALARLGQLKEAVEALEAGRARLLAEALEQNRRNLDQLKSLGHKDLLDRYRAASGRIIALQQQTSQPVTSSSDGPDGRLNYSARRQQMEAARKDLDASIAAIRQIPSYEDFFLPPTFAKVQQAAQLDAPLVYLLTTTAGSVALVVGAASENSEASAETPVSTVWLDSLTNDGLQRQLLGVTEDQLPAIRERLDRNTPTADDLRQLITSYLGAYAAWRGNPRDDAARLTWFAALDKTTRWLWDALIGPLLEQLTFSPGSAARATLIPTGLLSLLPLHAAWIEDPTAPTGRRYALDLLSIRYCPSAGALVASREVAGRITANAVLAVDNPDGSLVFSRQEVEAVRSYFPSERAKVLQGNAATRQAVLDQFPNFPIYHFSTHGWAGWSEPLQGGLLMAGGSTLTLADLLDLRLEGARLAVLSACETGIPGTKLPDEVVSLPTGLVQAGVAGVVASLWAVNDLSTAMLMERFYRLWRQDGLQPAEALCEAQRWLRDSTNREKAEYFKRDVPALAGFRMPAAIAADFYVDRMLTQNPNARDFAHPFFWGAFYLTGT